MEQPDKLTPTIRRYIRSLVLRSRHTGEFPEWPYTDPRTETLVRVLEEHKLKVEERSEHRLLVAHPRGRKYELTYGFSLDDPATKTWAYRTTVDPVNKAKPVGNKRQLALDFDAGTGPDGPPASDQLWWDRRRLLDGRFLSFDLETTLIVEGEYPAIVVASAATETGDAVLIEPEKIVDFLLLHHCHRPNQIWTGWNIAAFDLPCMFQRLPWAHERLYQPVFDRVMQGRMYDAMLFSILWDIGLYGVVYRPDSAVMFPWFRGRGVYSLEAQARRWFGLELDKSEQLTFGEYLGRCRDITDSQAAYVLGDSMVAASIQAIIYDHPVTWDIANKASREMVRLGGVVLPHPDPGIHPPLHLTANLEYGWQTHTVQFLGAFSLSWLERNGIEVDVDYTFKLLKELEADENRLFARLAGTPGRSILKVDPEKQTCEEVDWFPDPRDALNPEIYNRPDGSAPPEVFERDWSKEWQRLQNDPDKDPEVYYLIDPPPDRPATNSIADLKNREGETFSFAKPNNTGRLSVAKGQVREYAIQYPLADFTKDTARGLIAAIKREGGSVPTESPYFLQRWLAGFHRELDLEPRDKEAVLQKKEWMAFYGTNIISEFPDQVVRLSFQIAEIQKKIATVKSYLPGWKELTRSTKGARAMPLKALRTALRLDGVSRGRVFPGFKPLGAASARTAATSPNVQQVERDNRFRACFVSALGYLLVNADYATVEMATQGEIYAHRYHKQTLVNYINDGWDVHLLTGMQFRFPDRRDTWHPILGDAALLELKKTTDVEGKRKYSDAFVEAHPEFEWRRNGGGEEVLFNTRINKDITVFDQAGEDVAKDIWIAMLADALLDKSDLPWKKKKKEIKIARQAAKPTNFGIPGGMLPNRIRALAKTDYGVDMTPEEAMAAYKAWMQTYPEGVEWIKDGPAYLVEYPSFPFQPFYDRCFTLTGRLRGNLTKSDEGPQQRWKKKSESELPKQGHDEGLNEWHNTQFQGLAADLAKLAMFLIWFEGLVQNNFVHDENQVESPEELADEHAEILERRMREAAARVVRKANIGAAAKKMKIWQK